MPAGAPEELNARRQRAGRVEDMESPVEGVVGNWLAGEMGEGGEGEKAIVFRRVSGVASTASDSCS
jgi:hypothetical protein